MSFFKQFPKVEYDFNRTGVVQNMVDLFRHVRPLPAFLDNIAAYKFYEIINGERPDVVSTRLYGTPDFYWTFFVVNDFLHDGYRAWPMSQEQLLKYMEKEYNGFAIETNPTASTELLNSLAGRFTLGETITGASSNATGTLTKKNIDMSQLVVQNVTGAFTGFRDPLNSVNNTLEKIIGSSSGDFVDTYRVFKYADAPYYYYNENAGIGSLESIIIKNGGSGYTSAPTVTINGNGTTQATATAAITAGKVTSISITGGGKKYTNVSITISGGGGSGATAIATIFSPTKDPVSSAVHVVGGVADSDVLFVSNRTHEFELNEERSKIRYVDPNYIAQFVNAFKTSVNK